MMNAGNIGSSSSSSSSRVIQDRMVEAVVVS